VGCPERGSAEAFSSESLPRTRSGVDAGSREENASKQNGAGFPGKLPVPQAAHEFVISQCNIDVAAHH
jgi:hypothetical protein